MLPGVTEWGACMHVFRHKQTQISALKTPAELRALSSNAFRVDRNGTRRPAQSLPSLMASKLWPLQAKVRCLGKTKSLASRDCGRP